MLSLGMDIGTSTVKLVLLRDGAMAKQWMAVHHGRPFACLKKGLSALELDADTPFSLCVTGSNTEALLEQAPDIPSFGDIPAVVEGVRQIVPQAGSVIEIGSQGARFITDLQSRAPQFAVNEHCAGGTGSFFEDQMSRVGCKLEDYSSLVEQAQSVPRLSGRCAVFAKTDIIHRQQEGAATPDILLGLCYAMMHSMIPIICAAIFAGYYHISRWELATKISAYLEVLAVAFPFLIGIIVGLVVQIENQAGHYQLLLGTIPSRMATYIGKLGFLMICAFGATFLALGTFAALYRDAPASLYLKAGILLLITMLPIYLIHLFVGMSFGKGASMGLGIAGSLIAALMITGLGDATWKYIPWAWGVRAMDYTVLAWDSPQLYAQVKTDFFSGMIISVCCTVCLLIASLVWFHGWEGGKNSE